MLLHTAHETDDLMYSSNRHPHKTEPIILHRSLDIVEERNGLPFPSNDEFLQQPANALTRTLQNTMDVQIHSNNLFTPQRQNCHIFMLLTYTLTLKPNEFSSKAAFL